MYIIRNNENIYYKSNDINISNVIDTGSSKTITVVDNPALEELVVSYLPNDE